tara:strand:+ start:50 stop:541 length:492 start_codon:yes stop_codon:yes gene_type:complete
MGRATDFSNCYIYYIVDKEGIVHYVGSTSNFNSRKSKHKFCCKTEHDRAYNLDIYKYIRANGGLDKFEIVPIRKIENVSNKTELLIAENDEIKKFTGLKNMRGSYQTHEQKLECTRIWKENNPAKHAKSHRKACLNYRESNRLLLNEKSKQYYQKQKELKSDQ